MMGTASGRGAKHRIARDRSPGPAICLTRDKVRRVPLEELTSAVSVPFSGPNQ